MRLADILVEAIRADAAEYLENTITKYDQSKPMQGWVEGHVPSSTMVFVRPDCEKGMMLASLHDDPIAGAHDYIVKLTITIESDNLDKRADEDLDDDEVIEEDWICKTKLYASKIPEFNDAEALVRWLKTLKWDRLASQTWGDWKEDNGRARNEEEPDDEDQ